MAAKTVMIAGVGGKRSKFTHHSCHDSNGAAKARAVSVRAKQGIKVRVLKSGGKFCLYTGGKLKKKS